MDILPEFRRDFFNPDLRFTRIGSGGIGGKASALVSIYRTLASEFPSGSFGSFEINIPSFTVIGSDVFDSFLSRNNLSRAIGPDSSDEMIGHEFQRAEFPAEFLGDLRGLIEKVRVPLAVRSSSILEDSLNQPFAGIYTTKMIPNHQASADDRFRKFLEAIKLVYASRFFSGAIDYIRAAGRAPEEEKMAVVVQEVVGYKHRDRFYPDLSGVARSYNYYASGKMRPEHGVVSLALGLGKTIVDGGNCWTYSPAFPRTGILTSTADVLEQTQTKFWAVNMGKPPEYDPVKETEYLLHLDLSTAEEDETLQQLASTYDRQSDRLTPGISRQGARVLNFAGILQRNEGGFNDLMRTLLDRCRDALQTPVEIEFAATFQPMRFGFLQVRPMMVSTEQIEILPEDWSNPDLLISTNHALGNGKFDSINDIVYIPRRKFDFKFSRVIAQEIERLNRKMMEEKRPYLLLGFGRWGSSDPWLGIPVQWGQIAGAKIIVEASLASNTVELSQGSHFFHNLISFQVAYFSVRDSIDWDWIEGQPQNRMEYVHHIRLAQPLRILVDGTTRKGVVLKK